jgi:hypothetical protein
MADIITYTLMNKNTPVLACPYRIKGDTEAEDHSFFNIGKVTLFNLDYAPLGVFIEHKDGKDIDARSLNDWWKGRSIPASRLRKLEKKAILPISFGELKDRNFGLNLSDQFWIKPSGSDLTWDDVNYFTNPFSDDVGKALFGQLTPDDTKSPDFSFISPNATAEGNLNKKWIIADGKRVLVKAGSPENITQEPLNELIATRLYKRLLEPDDYVSYSLSKHGSYSLCETMVATDEELIPTYQILRYYKKSNNLNEYQRTIRCYANLGIPESVSRTALAKMLVCDLIIANADRHFNNFGIIRDVNTLRAKRIAPIWDSGISLYCDYNEFAGELSDRRSLPKQCWGYTSKPFNQAPLEQLRLIEDYSWYDPSKLRDFPDEVAALLGKSPITEISGSKRISTVVKHLEIRQDTITSNAHVWQIEHDRDHIYMPEHPSSLKARSERLSLAEKAQPGVAIPASRLGHKPPNR